MNQSEEERRSEWKSRRREYRERTERILRPLCSALKIDEDISNLDLRPVREYADLFPETDILAISGPGFERPTLPLVSSYMYCAYRRTNPNTPFIELTPRNSALGDLLAANWRILPDLSPVQLADFIFTMQTIETVSHEVLTAMTDLDKPSRRDEGFVMNDDARRLMDESPIKTSLATTDAGLSIHALTLFGWMHEKQNLGVTDINIAHDGDLHFGERRTICDPAFRDIPRIWY